MSSFGELLKKRREFKRVSVKKASERLLIKKEHLVALEDEDWAKLPESTFVKGYIKNYSDFLGLDSTKMLALYRRDFDERKFPKKQNTQAIKKTFPITAQRLRITIFVIAIIAFISYLLIQYSSILQAPDLEIIQPPQDNVTVSVPIVEISGKAEGQSQVVVNGEFVPIDQDGNFSYYYRLEEGRNTVEIIASKRLSPKTKIIRTIRLIQ